MEDKKNWLEPTEVIEYNEEKGQICLNDPENDWSNKITDGIGEAVDDTEADG